MIDSWVAESKIGFDAAIERGVESQRGAERIAVASW
jgi:hypothetical protein